MRPWGGVGVHVHFLNIYKCVCMCVPRSSVFLIIRPDMEGLQPPAVMRWQLFQLAAVLESSAGPRARSWRVVIYRGWLQVGSL